MDLSLSKFKIVKEFKSSKWSRVYLVETPESRGHFIHKTVYLRENHHHDGEIQVHSQLQHRHIIKLVHSEVFENRFVMLIEHARHGDLYSWINRLYVLSDHKVLKFYREVVEAVAYMHAKGFAHRDIKPENILIAKRFSPKLADFGASEEIDKLSNTFCGTLEYMAPEILLRHKQTEKVDIWALGVLLYEMFHGASPFRNMKVDNIKHRLRGDGLRYKTDLCPKIRALIDRLLKFDPEERPTAEDILNDEALSFFCPPSFSSAESLGSFSKIESMAELRDAEEISRDERNSISSCASKGFDSDGSLRSISQEPGPLPPKQSSKNRRDRFSQLSKSKFSQSENKLEPCKAITDLNDGSSIQNLESSQFPPNTFKRGGSTDPVCGGALQSDIFGEPQPQTVTFRNLSTLKEQAALGSPKPPKNVSPRFGGAGCFLSRDSSQCQDARCDLKKESLPHGANVARTFGGIARQIVNKALSLEGTSVEGGSSVSEERTTETSPDRKEPQLS